MLGLGARFVAPGVSHAESISAAKFKEQCLALLDSVDEEGLVITKRGKPVARLFPMRSDGAHLIGLLARTLEVRGDIMSTGIAWDATDAES